MRPCDFLFFARKMIFFLSVGIATVLLVHAQLPTPSTPTPAVVNASELDGLFALYDGIGA
jgi:hypothetical protein